MKERHIDLLSIAWLISIVIGCYPYFHGIFICTNSSVGKYWLNILLSFCAVTEWKARLSMLHSWKHVFLFPFLIKRWLVHIPFMRDVWEYLTFTLYGCHTVYKYLPGMHGYHWKEQLCTFFSLVTCSKLCVVMLCHQSLLCSRNCGGSVKWWWVMASLLAQKPWWEWNKEGGQRFLYQHQWCQHSAHGHNVLWSTRHACSTLASPRLIRPRTAYPELVETRPGRDFLWGDAAESGYSKRLLCLLLRQRILGLRDPVWSSRDFGWL